MCLIVLGFHIGTKYGDLGPILASISKLNDSILNRWLWRIADSTNDSDLEVPDPSELMNLSLIGYISVMVISILIFPIVMMVGAFLMIILISRVNLSFAIFMGVACLSTILTAISVGSIFWTINNYAGVKQWVIIIGTTVLTFIITNGSLIVVAELTL
jgi:hypothetical protein